MIRPRLPHAQVKALVEEGGAEFDVRDRWSLDPLDEAMVTNLPPADLPMQQ